MNSNKKTRKRDWKYIFLPSQYISQCSLRIKILRWWWHARVQTADRYSAACISLGLWFDNFSLFPVIYFGFYLSRSSELKLILQSLFLFLFSFFIAISTIFHAKILEHFSTLTGFLTLRENCWNFFTKTKVHFKLLCFLLNFNEQIKKCLFQIVIEFNALEKEGEKSAM